MTAIHLPIVVSAFRCVDLARTVTPSECADNARTAISAPGPKVARPCASCDVGDAHMRGEVLLRIEPEDQPRSARNNRPLFVELNGAMVSVSRAAELTGLDRRTVKWRTARGIPLDAPRTRGPNAAPRPAAIGRPRPADLMRQLRAAGYVATPEVRDGRSVLVVAWPEDAATGRQEAAE